MLHPGCFVQHDQFSRRMHKDPETLFTPWQRTRRCNINKAGSTVGGQRTESAKTRQARLIFQKFNG
jgi:hypothetical protein